MGLVTATLPIILLTGCSEKEILLQAFHAGTDDFLLKPFSPAELLACVYLELSPHRGSCPYGTTFQLRLAAMKSTGTKPNVAGES